MLPCHADILRVMPSKAIELTAFDAYKKLLSHEDRDGKLKRPGPLLTALAGAAAGRTFTCALPCHLICVKLFELEKPAPRLTKLSRCICSVHAHEEMCTS